MVQSSKLNRCPYFTRKVGSYRWKGIKCTSQKWSQGLTLGELHEWTEEQRKQHIEKYCNGDYKTCWQYRNHTQIKLN